MLHGRSGYCAPEAAIIQDGKVIKVSVNLNRAQITILALLGKECKNYYGMN